jgi:hypothetical protein
MAIQSNDEILRTVDDVATSANYGVDYSGTETGRDKLRAVRDQHRRTTIAEAKVCLSAVRLAKSKLL